MGEEADPLNPDEQQRLFEKLSMTEEDLAMLNYIRRDVKIIIKQEQNGRQKLTIIKTKVPTRTHKLTATWTRNLEDEPSWEDVPVDIANLTLEEQADLIVKKLSTPPKPDGFSQRKELELLSKSIADEIDAEILKELKGLK